MKLKTKKKLARFAENGVFHFIGKFLYFFGLTTLIPVLPIVIFSPVKKLADTAILVSILFIAIGVVLEFVARKSPRKALRSLGYSTLFPAAVAFIFAIFGKKFIIALLLKFHVTSYFIVPWIQEYVPTVIFIAIAYALIGFALIGSSFFWKKK